MEDYNNDSMYLVEGKEKALLIDTGLGGGNVKKMAESLTSLPVELAVTHAHIDHLLSGDVFEKYYMSKKDVPLLPRLNDGTGKNFTEKDVIDIEAVSYTHLAHVRKRLRGGARKADAVSAGGMNPLEAVSYTHLRAEQRFVLHEPAGFFH